MLGGTSLWLLQHLAVLAPLPVPFMFIAQIINAELPFFDEENHISYTRHDLQRLMSAGILIRVHGRGHNREGYSSALSLIADEDLMEDQENDEEYLLNPVIAAVIQRRMEPDQPNICRSLLMQVGLFFKRKSYFYCKNLTLNDVFWTYTANEKRRRVSLKHQKKKYPWRFIIIQYNYLEFCVFNLELTPGTISFDYAQKFSFKKGGFS